MPQDVTYADLKFSQSPPEGTRLEDLTYANVQASSHQEPKGGSKRPPWLLAAGMAGIALVLLVALIALGVHHLQFQKASEEEKGQLASRLDRAMEDLNQTQESKTQMEQVLNATWAQVAKEWCPENWILYQGKCLLFSTEKKSWTESKESCDAHSSRLLITRSWQPGQLAGLLRNREYWIGLRKTQEEKTRSWIWTWADGSKYERNDLSDYGTDSCAYLNNGERWSYYCYYTCAYICEKTKAGTQ
uniref:C-type lectin domain-containing protein n=1 Tax=Anolis carolinensis TaxID=28377 RepID=A0A803TEZ0_ANOCA|nr:PREDICTED: C-type lectin domain family 7 member A isoform X1 [Anolis carolinensis]|eukprot:XP_008119898.1 PREDICTED: C-type lectin domain family 7 member A isoform X1 [Anolis carolinensis]